MRYCSVKCQRQHRHIHRDDCRMMSSPILDNHSRTGDTSAEVDDDNASEQAKKGRKRRANRRNDEGTARVVHVPNGK